MNHVPVRTIINTVAKHYGIDPVLMFGSLRRQRHISTPRHVAMYLARRLTCMSLQAVADAFLVSDHTTVIYAERKVHRWVRDGDLDVEPLVRACVSPPSPAPERSSPAQHQTTAPRQSPAPR